MDIKPDQTLDCTGLSCPVPVIKVARALKKMASGEILEMIGTDPGSLQDVPDWCNRTGNELLNVVEDGGTHRFYVKKK